METCGWVDSTFPLYVYFIFILLKIMHALSLAFFSETDFTPLIATFCWVVRVRDLRSNASGLHFTLFLNYISGLS
jgi:hypothetical protein